MNQINFGFNNQIELPKGGYFLITDEFLDIPRSKKFDPKKHSFNFMEGMTEDKAEEDAELFYTLSPGGEATLTVRNGKIALASAIMEAETFDKVKGNEEVTLMRDSILFSPTRRRVLCGTPNFKFSPDAKIQARLNRKELGEKSALIIGLLLLSIYPGQCIVPDLGFYGRDIHTRLIREERLIAGINFLAELPPKLRRTVLLIEEKIVSGSATADDAELLAMYARLEEKTMGYNDFVKSAIA